jgi:DNA-binding NarL/FixJ family response regulator
VTTPGELQIPPSLKAILRELHTGASNKEIAARLGLSEATVKVYLSAMLYKLLGVSNRVEAALWAERSGWFA